MTEHNRQIDYILSANKSRRLDKNKSDQDLEQRIIILEKERDTLKTIIDLKDVEINTLKEEKTTALNMVKAVREQNEKLIEEAQDMLLYP
jgi:FtsZ-binding cell division protein ZapB